MKKIINAVIMVLAGFFIALIYSGLFSTVDISEREIGPFILVYQHHTGDYAGTGDIQNTIYQTLRKEFNVSATKGFGQYYDDPKKVPAEKLRSIAGCILEPEYRDRIPAIAKKYIVSEYKKTKSVVAVFPYKNQLSIFLGVLRVYPALDKYIQHKGYPFSPALEIYDLGSKKIIYSFPIQQ
ncbi:MAG TPA: hypothetical protein PKX12_00140 [Spirochaetota bacterium]|nr:hypothetical protein [Spirochaetota bacterium]